VVGKEVLEGLGGGEGLLHFLGASEVGEDGGAFDGSAAFEVVAAGPGSGGVFGWRVEGAEVHDGYFVRGRRG